MPRAARALQQASTEGLVLETSTNATGFVSVHWNRSTWPPHGAYQSMCSVCQPSRRAASGTARGYVGVGFTPQEAALIYARHKRSDVHMQMAQLKGAAAAERVAKRVARKEERKVREQRKRQRTEEAAQRKQRKEETEAQRKGEKEARKKAMQAGKQRKEETEAQRKGEKEARKKAMQAGKQRKEETEAQRKEEKEAQRKEEKEARKKAMQAEMIARKQQMAADQRHLFEEARRRQQVEGARRQGEPPTEPMTDAADGAEALQEDVDVNVLVAHVLKFKASPHACLGMAPGEGREAIRKRFLHLCLRLHPDKSAHPEAQGAFAAVEAAFRAWERSENYDHGTGVRPP